MTKPFDIEAARQGHPVQTAAGTIVRFIGQMSDGRIVLERAGELRHAPESELRMAPKPEMVWVVTWWFKGTVLNFMTAAFHDEECVNRYISDHKCELPHASPKITPVEIQP